MEFCLKSDDLGDPLISEEHILCFEWASPQDVDEITNLALRTNDYLSGFFSSLDIVVADFKLEFGRMLDENGNDRLMIGDEISPDTCRLWDKQNQRRLDKDRFRLDLDEPLSGYKEVARRLGVLPGVALDDRTILREDTKEKSTKNTTENEGQP